MKHTLLRYLPLLVLALMGAPARGQTEPGGGATPAASQLPQAASEGDALAPGDEVDRGPEARPDANGDDDTPDSRSFTSPDQVQNLLDDQQQDAPSWIEADWLEGWKGWKSDLYDDTGLNFGGDYNALLFAATDSLGEDTASSGVFRLYGHWDLIGRGTNDTGGLIFKIEHRHRYGSVAPSAFGGEVGYLGALQTTFTDVGYRTTNLYWRQSFADQRFVVYAGFVDSTDFLDVYALASPWTGFNNLVFATGSATIGGLPDGALGAMGALWLTDSLYTIASLTDANADATDITDGFDTFFNEFETLKTLEVGWAPERERALLEKISVSFWHIDEASTKGTPSGWGVSGSATVTIHDEWLAFLRGGWADDGGSLNEGSVSVGFGYQPDPNGSLLALGLNWGRPNRGTFPGDPDDQFTSELFYRCQVSPNLQVTPSVQLLVDPAANPEEDVVAVFGIRARYTF